MRRFASKTVLMRFIAAWFLAASLMSALGVGEGDIGRGSAAALVVGDNLDTVVLPNSDAVGSRGRDRYR